MQIVEFMTPYYQEDGLLIELLQNKGVIFIVGITIALAWNWKKGKAKKQEEESAFAKQYKSS